MAVRSDPILAGHAAIFDRLRTRRVLAFAALASPITVPPEYGVPLPAVGELPDRMAATVRELRAHPAGEFALRLYREERRPA